MKDWRSIVAAQPARDDLLRERDSNLREIDRLRAQLKIAESYLDPGARIAYQLECEEALPSYGGTL